jgi:hypothetical protein
MGRKKTRKNGRPKVTSELMTAGSTREMATNAKYGKRVCELCCSSSSRILRFANWVRCHKIVLQVHKWRDSLIIGKKKGAAESF